MTTRIPQVNPSTLLALWLGCAVFVASPSAKDPLGFQLTGSHAHAQSRDLGRELDAIERQFSDIQQRYLAPELMNAKFAPESRLNDGIVAHSLKQYDTAAQLFFQVVEQAGPSFQGHRDALYYLADSLAQMRNYLGARSYYRRLILLGPGKHYKDALARMLEISYQLNDYDQLEDLSQKLDLAAVDSPTLAYLRGKSLFAQKKLPEARRYFDLSMKEKEFAIKARYFKGVTYVVGREFPQAEQEFRAIVGIPRTEENARLRALSFLALGRLAYEQDRYNEAIGHFNSVFDELPSGDRTKNEATYETAWANIQLKQYQEAQQLIDILIASAPDADLYTRAMLLRADLASRSKDYDRAVESFERVLERYEPVRNQLDTFVQKHDDLPGFFRTIVREDLTLDIPPELPAIRTDFDTQPPSEWLGASIEANTGQRVVQDVRMTKQDIEESRAALMEVKARLASSSRLKSFPKIAGGLTIIASLQSELIDVQRRLYDGALSEASSLSGTDAAAFAPLRAEVDRLEPKYRATPTNGNQLLAREQQMQSDFNQMEKRIRELGESIDDIRAELAALDIYAKNGQVPLSAEQQQQVETLRKELFEATTTLEKERTGLRNELKLSKRLIGLGDVLATEEVTLRQSYSDALSKANAFLAARGLKANAQTDTLLPRVRGISAGIADYYAKTDTIVDQQVKDYEGQVRLSELEIENQEAMIESMAGSSRETAAEIALNTFLDKRQEFNKIVLRADVGKIDVLYQKKEDATNKINDLFQRRTDELRALQDSFDELK